MEDQTAVVVYLLPCVFISNLDDMAPTAPLAKEKDVMDDLKSLAPSLARHYLDFVLFLCDQVRE